MRQCLKCSTVAFACVVFLSGAGMEASETGRVETGQVNWLHNLDEAKQLATAAEKPILLLFQEIPG